MTLMHMYDTMQPNVNEKSWPQTLLTNFEPFMNGLPSTIDTHLENQGLHELVLRYLASGNRQWHMNLKNLTANERVLFNIEVLSLVDPDNKTEDNERLVHFTSGLIYCICLHSVLSKRKIRSSEMLRPILLLEKARMYIRPSQLDIKKAWNLRGPAEYIFQIELYSVFYDLPPEGWRCGSEVHPDQGDHKLRMDLHLMSDSGGSGVGFELKVDKVTEEEVDKAITKAQNYAKKFAVDIYVVNFLSRFTRPPKADIIKQGNLRIFLVNVPYNDGLMSLMSHTLKRAIRTMWNGALSSGAFSCILWVMVLVISGTR
ncbi:hypothetical protein VTN96DRAFT_9116 [Rasamsonia emersonii]